MKEKIKKDWSTWKYFENLNQLFEIPCIYKIRCANTKGKSIATHRLRGIDREGILDIGESKNLKVRMTDFLGAARGNPNYSHQAGVNFSRRHYKDIFPIKRIQFKYLVRKDKKSARRLEKKELNDYTMKFGEQPPLNSKE